MSGDGRWGGVGAVVGVGRVLMVVDCAKHVFLMGFS